MSGESLPRFDRSAWGREAPPAGGGGGGPPPRGGGGGPRGGTGGGRVFARRLLAERHPSGEFSGIRVGVPAFTVLATDVFDAFVKENGLLDLLDQDLPDARIAHAFQRGDLPAEIVGDLERIAEASPWPLAVRSSSLLEDALRHPFAGVYETKMLPNNLPDPRLRFRRLAEAIKLVFASTWFGRARTYARAAGKDSRDEKMAVVIQEVVGLHHHERFYPNLSGVARSINVYPHGPARRDEGVVSLALGLGKTIVDGGTAWSYSPAHPAAPPPYLSARELMQNSQLRFWSVNMGAVALFDPIAETEFLSEAGLDDAELDGTLGWIASTYEPASDRLFPGVEREGARVIDFSPLREYDVCPLDPLVRSLLTACEEATGGAVEIEFAATFPQRKHPEPPQFGFLQVRPMLAGTEPVVIAPEETADPRALVVGERVMGNGIREGIADVIYVKPDRFDPKDTRRIAEEVARLARPLFAERRPYLLIGFGRWGSQDPWLGVPVSWDQIAGASVIVEGSTGSLDVEPSQGAHFFQNMTGFGVIYFSLDRAATAALDWEWLAGEPAEGETEFVRHVRLGRPLTVKADGRSGRGGIWRSAD